MVLGGPATHVVVGEAHPTTDELRARYAAYRQRQARELLHLIPREAVRPLYRRAAADRNDAAEPQDLMQTLVDFCQGLLPLPPFEVWLADLRQNPEAYLGDADAPADAPVTLASHTLRGAYDAWDAHLRVFRDGDTWRGFIAFESSQEMLVHRTALVFCESSPDAVRERFALFEAPSLEAFLRSSLPR